MCPHVFIFPLPLQGPVKCMLKLAEILSLEGIKVTFLNSHHIQQRLLHTQSHFTKYPNFRFQTLPDGLPDDNPRTGDQILNLLQSMEAVAMPLFREMLTSALDSDAPATCLIADGVFTFAAHVASQIAVPLLYFDTISPCGLWSLLCLPRLIQAGEVPFGDEKLDEMVRNAPGMEGVMRYRDLPSFCRIKEVEDPIIQLVIEEAKHIPVAQGLVFNTFEQLEGPILSEMRSICSNVYAIGPLHAHLKTRVAAETPAATSNSIWEEDSSCISWLHKQPSKSVIYVSVGSLAVMTKHQLYEIWNGLVNSGSRFLWVRRPGSVSGSGSSDPDHEIPLDLLQATKERGYIVSWAPQEEVLAHDAVGAFLTHCGWNSTLESMTSGKPMICWPFHADQQVNSRYVGEVWKLGLDMKDSCDRVVVEEMVREVMELRKDEFLKRGEAMAELAESSVSRGGSSFLDLDRLIEDIKMMKIPIKQNYSPRLYALITFLNTEYIQERLNNHTNAQTYFHKYPDFGFQTLPDGLPEDNPRTGDQIGKLLESMEASAVPIFREMLMTSGTPVSCLIADGIFTFATDIAAEVGVPLLYFDTISPCGFWTYLCLPNLIQAGEIPFKDDNLDEMIRNVPGMEGIIRRRDLPSFCRTKDLNDRIIQLVLNEGNHIPLAQGLIFNTFQHLEAPILSQILNNICPNIYAVGPLNAHLKARLAAETISNSIWEEDQSCISWLHKQPSKSVVYVSIGSLAVITKDQMYEIWHGLVNSGTRFLWVRRPGSVLGLGSERDEEIPVELSRGTKERGYVVSWAPQEEVLAHPAVGGFLTHSGWNSTLESMVSGKPMICWPYFVDQQVNSRYVGEVWKLGLDMKDSCDRVIVEKMVKEVMELRKDEFLQRAEEMAELANKAVGPGGSSFADVDRLIQDIKMMKITTKSS